MISGAKEKELDIANDRADLLLEIARLNKRNKELEDGFKATVEEVCEYATKIDKAIEYIKSYRDENTNWYEFTIQNKIELLEILGDKE